VGSTLEVNEAFVANGPRLPVQDVQSQLGRDLATSGP
jgi:hypothetical protein